jgi:hypothetical protein
MDDLMLAAHPGLCMHHPAEATTRTKETKVQPKQTNVERLSEAGILNVDHFSPHDKETIEKISPDEVDVLIKLGKKMGPTPMGKEHMRPNFPV